jgi:hypothetical protein
MGLYLDILDKTEFTKLFSDRKVNHREICEMLDRLCATLANSPSLRPCRRDWLGDARQHVTLHCIDRIDRFKYRPDGNAARYYLVMAVRELRRFYRHVKRTEMISLSG